MTKERRIVIMYRVTEPSKDDIKRGRPQKCLNVEVGRSWDVVHLHRLSIFMEKVFHAKKGFNSSLRSTQFRLRRRAVAVRTFLWSAGGTFNVVFAIGTTLPTSTFRHFCGRPRLMSSLLGSVSIK